MFCTKCGNEIKGIVKFCTKCGNRFHIGQQPTRRRFFTKKRAVFFVATGLLLIIALFLYYNSHSSESIDYDIASSVVNIYCEGDTEEEVFGGSGTIFTEDGLVLTNAHIIPESAKDDIYVDDTFCLVTLPDPDTGSPEEIYYAYPILVEELSDEYDLAFMQIHDVFYDHEEGIAYGEYPKKFSAYSEQKKCSDYIKLGESVRIYGYPAISGGYALTITDGIVSSLLIDEGLIITSAKISYGNSGGLAVDNDGCMIGIPSMVTGDENESMGIIISNDII